jgi:hypothetical protein
VRYDCERPVGDKHLLPLRSQTLFSREQKHKKKKILSRSPGPMPIAHLDILRRTQFTRNELSQTQSADCLSVSFNLRRQFRRWCRPNGYPSIARGQFYKFGLVSEEIRPSGRPQTHAGVGVPAAIRAGRREFAGERFIRSNWSQKTFDSPF